MSDLAYGVLHHVFGGADINTALLAVIAVDNKRILPMLAGLFAHFKIPRPRAFARPATEPPTE
jgi:hypothetical protein